ARCQPSVLRVELPPRRVDGRGCRMGLGSGSRAMTGRSALPCSPSNDGDVRIADPRAVCEPVVVTVTAVPASLLERLSDPDLLRADLFVGGEWAPASDGGRFDVVDPADGSLVASVA